MNDKWYDGYAAYFGGILEIDNPYNDETTTYDFISWENGWDSANKLYSLAKMMYGNLP